MPKIDAVGDRSPRRVNLGKDMLAQAGRDRSATGHTQIVGKCLAQIAGLRRTDVGLCHAPASDLGPPADVWPDAHTSVRQSRVRPG